MRYLANNVDGQSKVAQAIVNNGLVDASADKLFTNVDMGSLSSNKGNEFTINLDNDTFVEKLRNGYSGYQADIIDINDKVRGTTNVIFKDMNDGDIDYVNLGVDERIYFAQTQKTENLDMYGFDVVNGHNPIYEILMGHENSSLDSSAYDWYLYRGKLNPDIVTLIDLPRAAIEQTRSIMIDGWRTNVGQCKCYQDDCTCEPYWEYETTGPKAKLWATPMYRNGTFDKPVETDFDIKGVDFGLDYQGNTQEAFGVFGSYRKGNYENKGKGKKYTSRLGGELDITSILGGVYYRRYIGNTYLLGAIYGGNLDVDMKAKNGVTASVDGKDFGAMGEIGYDAHVSDRSTFTPSLRASYDYIKFDKFKDSAGKEFSYEKVHDVELEAAVKYQYQFNNENQLPTIGYIKPSVIQTIANGGDLKVADNKFTDLVENETLGRIEIGADANLTRRFSVGIFGNYTFGSEYQAWGAGANIRYIW